MIRERNIEFENPAHPFIPIKVCVFDQFKQLIEKKKRGKKTKKKRGPVYKIKFPKSSPLELEF